MQLINTFAVMNLYLDVQGAVLALVVRQSNTIFQ
jgi:hypothetical protein